MNDKTFIINTYSEEKYKELSSKASDKQLHIVDNDNMHRTVVPSYDLLINQVKLSLGYDESSAKILLKDCNGNEISKLDASRFISDNYLMSAAYDNGYLMLSILLSDQINVISVEFPVDQSLNPLSDYSDSTYPVASKAVVSAILELSGRVGNELTKLNEDLNAAIEGLNVSISKEEERASTKEEEIISRQDEIVNEFNTSLAGEINRAKESEETLLNAINDEHIVRYEDGKDNRKHIFLKNYDSVVGYLSGDGAGSVNLAMVSKWNVADFGSNTIPLNLNAKDGIVTINDSLSVATLEDVQKEQQERAKNDEELGKSIAAETNRAIEAEKTKVDREISSDEGRALIFNESVFAGAKFENNNGIESFVGVHNGDNGIVAQIYADKMIDGKWNGAKLDVTHSGMYYTVGDQNAAERDVLSNEIATIGKIDEERARATKEEDEIANNLAGMETSLNQKITDEIERAKGAESKLNVQIAKSSADEFLAQYEFTQGGKLIGKIDIPKDFLVRSGQLKECTENDNAKDGYLVGDKYIDLVVNAKDCPEEESHIYILVKELVDVYSAGEGLTMKPGNVFQISAEYCNLITAIPTISTTLDEKIDTISNTLDGKIDTIDKKTDTINNTLDEKIDTVDKKIDTINNTLDEKIDKSFSKLENEKVTGVITTDNNKSLIFNEGTGGGAKNEDNANSIWSFVGVNQQKEKTGPYGSMYVINANSKIGTRLKMYENGFTYSKNCENPKEFNSEDEIATIKDIDNLSNKYISIEALKSALSDINDDIDNIEMEEIGQALLNIKRLVNANS